MANVGDPVVVHEGGGDVVLGRQRVGRAQPHLGAAGDQRADQVGGLGGDVQAGGEALAGERLLHGEALADRGEHRHVAVGPEDLAQSCVRQGQVADVVETVGGGAHRLFLRGARGSDARRIVACQGRRRHPVGVYTPCPPIPHRCTWSWTWTSTWTWSWSPQTLEWQERDSRPGRGRGPSRGPGSGHAAGICSGQGCTRSGVLRDS